MHTVLQVIVLILQLVHLIVGVFGIPVYKIYKGGNLISNILLCWGLYVLWAVAWCVILPALFLPLGKNIYSLFPEAVGVGLIVFLGWIPSVICFAFAYAIIKIVAVNKDMDKADSL